MVLFFQHSTWLKVWSLYIEHCNFKGFGTAPQVEVISTVLKIVSFPVPIIG